MTTTEVAAAKPPAEITVEDFSVLVGNLNRLLTGLSSLKPLKDNDLGLADWLVLTTLAKEDGINNKTLARNLGISGQRANQICMSLASDSLIVVNQSAEDRRANSITITEAGRAKVATLNTQLKLLLSSALEGKERALKRGSRLIRNLMGIVRARKAVKLSEAEREATQANRKAKKGPRAKENETGTRP